MTFLFLLLATLAAATTAANIEDNKHGAIANVLAMHMDAPAQEALNNAMNEFDEINALRNDQEIFAEMFETIDPENNDDVDVNEWKKGLFKLGINLQDEDMDKLFELMDHDSSGFIEKADWISFLTTTFESRELQRLQNSILDKCKGHKRTPSNLVKQGDISQWTTRDLKEMSQEMSQEIVRQATMLQESVQAETTFYDEIEKRASEVPDFAKPDRVEEWTPQEVAYWLDSIELGQYGRAFNEEGIDGTMILNDYDRFTLNFVGMLVVCKSGAMNCFIYIGFWTFGFGLSLSANEQRQMFAMVKEMKNDVKEIKKDMAKSYQVLLVVLQSICSTVFMSGGIHSYLANIPVDMSLFIGIYCGIFSISVSIAIISVCVIRKRRQRWRDIPRWLKILHSTTTKIGYISVGVYMISQNETITFAEELGILCFLAALCIADLSFTYLLYRYLQTSFGYTCKDLKRDCDYCLCMGVARCLYCCVISCEKCQAMLRKCKSCCKCDPQTPQNTELLLYAGMQDIES